MMNKSVDALIVGGGAVGLATLYYLAKAGIAAHLVDCGPIGNGTSSRCDGNVMVSDGSPGYDTQFALAGMNMFHDLADELSYDIQWEQRGSLTLFENESEMELGKEHLTGLLSDGVKAKIIDQVELRRQEPFLAQDIVGAIDTDCDGCLDPMSLVFAYSLAAQRLGAFVHQYTRVLGIDVLSDGKYAVYTTKGEFLSPVVINCAGAWSAQIGDMVGLRVPIKPRQGMILVAEQTFRIARRKTTEFGYLMAKSQKGKRQNITPDMEKFGIALVYEPTHANNFLLGSSRRFVGFDTRSDQNVMRSLAQRGIRFFPVMKDINIIRSYAGVRPYCEDHIPIVSQTHLPGFYINAGHEGNGIGMAPISGLIISKMITGDDNYPIDPSPLDYSRFL